MENKPFLRWAGGKFKLVDIIASFIPNEINYYWEPFVGAGSLFFKILPAQATLSDLNESLINCYKQIKNNPIKVFNELHNILKDHSETNYYKIRDLYNSKNIYDPQKAAIFIYLNKTCFNGIYRVNTQNKFNVPYGKILKPALPSRDTLLNISRCLKMTELLCFSYEDIFDKVKLGDFVYLDPPYPPLNDTSKFVEYTKERFTLNDQEKVAIFAKSLSEKGSLVMISNANTPYIKELYKDWNIFTTTVSRTISCKKERYQVEELIITNY